MELNVQAQELNAIIEKHNPKIMNVLSRKGKEVYFPAQGILAQTAAARNCKINATIGIALEEDKSTACLPALAELTRLEGTTAFQYAPPTGQLELRDLWKKMMFEKNPSLAGVPISLPVVSSALTHAIYIAAQMFLDADDCVIISDYFWENYELVLCRSTGAERGSFQTFAESGNYNTEGLKNALADGGVGKKVVLLNFPNNPTGYTPTIEEAHKIRDILVEEAERGSSIAVIVDDAYFGLVYEEGVFTESLFALLANAHENILAVKIDGPTKEDYAWGLRTGFLTFGVKGGNPELYGALEQKVAGFIREQISSASKVSQVLLIDAYKAKNYSEEKCEKYSLLKKRYDKIKEILAANLDYANYFEALPFNSGYFMCVRPKNGIDSENVRILLAEKHSIGLIQLQGLLRIAFSSTPTDELPVIFESIYKSCLELAKRG
ncbi:MAG: aminotransferase class I/II-fold pyridoxal phosphate-dependent enzyme [Chitinivibrionia bacterium]|nr:aminotransferase class I/II-fold pyridoxal phosphate-dependent enzyme [Chitinivibrionia bacterium]